MSFLILFGRASVNISEHWKLAEFEVKKNDGFFFKHFVSCQLSSGA